MLFSNQVAIVTGSSRGLGRHIALSLAEEGANIILVYHENQDKAVQVKREIESMGQRALVLQADVSSEPDVQNMVNRTVSEFSRIDILINNAGVSSDAMSWKFPTDSWHHVIEVNLTGPFLCTKHVLPVMRPQSSGRIINIASVVGQTGNVGTSAYSASKSGLIGLTKTVAREVASRGITVNALALGYFDEGMLRTLPATIREDLLARIPIGRFGSVSELTWAIRFLSAPQAAYITGQVININGGFYI